MRTTVTIDDDLYRRAKAHAALTGQPVGSVIEDALRDLLERHAEGGSVTLDLPVFSGTFNPAVDINDTSAVLDFLDEGVPLDERR